MDLQPGQMLGAYRIINQVGQGGMATVFRAYQAAMDRYVAIKVLPSQFARSDEFIGRFKQEARTIANLEHSHILPVYDYGEQEGITYFVMRYLDTGTLKDRIASGPLTLQETHRLFTQLAEALGYAHARGVIHRDIKPSNALIDQHGDLFLTDFGIAKLVEATQHFTASGALTGTPAYMSPEQARGEKLDARSDIYSLGIVLYEMVTGRVPFEAETPLAVVLKHLQEPLPPPSLVMPDVSPAVEAVILKALAKDRGDRFETVGEFLAAWKKALAEATSESKAGAQRAVASATVAAKAAVPSAPTVPTPQRAETAARPRSPLVLILGGAGLLIVLIAALLLSVFGQRKGGTPTPVIAATAVGAVGSELPTIEPTLESAEAAAPSTQWTSWTAGNTVFSVVVRGDEILTGGPGGITVWNRADGSIVRRFTTADGLPNAVVNMLYVDTDESVWAGTEGGLAHFDGQSWTTYTTEDGLDTNYVSAIMRDGDSLIVGTGYSYDGGGLNVFDGSGWKPVPDFPSASPDEDPSKLSYNVNAIAKDASGALLVATSNGLGRFADGVWTRYSTADGLPDDLILSIFVTDDAALIGTNSGVVRFDSQGIQPIEQLSGVGVHSILQDSHGEFWFSGGGGLWRFTPANANWETYSADTGELPSFTMYGAAMDADGILYFASETGGLSRYDGDQFITWAVPNIPTQAAFGRILAAPDGLLWFVQLWGANVDRFNPVEDTWSPLYNLPCSCEPLAFDANGNLWAGEYNNGLWIVGRDTQTHVSADEGLPVDYQVRALAFAADGATWIGTDHGVAYFDGQQVAAIFDTSSAGFASDYVSALYAASDGSLWLGTDVDLSRMTPDGSWEHFGVGNPFNYTVPVTDIAEDAGGVIWIATEGDGVFRFAGGRWQQFSAGMPGVKLPSSYVRSVTIAPDGSVWFGTTNGAARFNGSDWYVFKVADGLINANVNDIYVIGEDPDSEVWFATSGGVSRFWP